MVFPRKVFHLTVNHEGLVSLWDNRDRAMAAAEHDEVYVQLLLSLTQTEKLKKAQREAKEKGKK